jgi:pyruvate formate lyase activating enzyme
LTSGLVFDIQRYCIHDGPGIRSTVFFKGCPLACWWCHNPEGQTAEADLIVRANRCVRCGACMAACGQGALSWQDDTVVTDMAKCQRCGDCADACVAEARQLVGRRMTVAQVMAQVERDVPFYDQSGGGVTFSGGEPLSQPSFLLDLLEACGCAGIHRAVETCGYASWETCDRIRLHTDLFLYDLKLMDGGRHRQYTGVSNDIILDNLRRLTGLGHPIVLRVPIIPRLNDDAENLRQIGTFAASLPRLEQIDLLPYHLAADKYERLNRDYALGAVRPPSAERLAELAHILEGHGLQVTIGG